jgi:uncharacterized protein (DUF433 family)
VGQRHDPHALGAPLYSPADAARYLGLPVATVRSWVKGRAYRTQKGTAEFIPVVLPADPSGALSFRSLVELQVLRSLRVKHGVRLETIRRAIEFMRKQLRVKHPLADHRMRTSGKELFINLVEMLLRADDGQLAFGKVLGEHLDRIEWVNEHPTRLYPFPHTGPRGRRAVVLDPCVRWGKPVLVGTAIPVGDIAERKTAGESISSIARDYGRPITEIRSALRSALRYAV